jgi:predicted RNA-binding protein with RPS1 domain
MRELSWPGRDPRPRLLIPDLLEPDTDPIRLVKDRVVEGVVSNVASFGIFVDVGLPADAMVHISEISERYVRDARELLSVGEIVRARILEAGGPRLTLSLKNGPSREREQRPRGGPRDRGLRGRGPEVRPRAATEDRSAAGRPDRTRAGRVARARNPGAVVRGRAAVGATKARNRARPLPSAPRRRVATAWARAPVAEAAPAEGIARVVATSAGIAMPRWGGTNAQISSR